MFANSAIVVFGTLQVKIITIYWHKHGLHVKDFEPQCGEKNLSKGFMTRPQVMKICSCSTHMSIEFDLLKNTEIAKLNGNFRFKSPKASHFPCYC